MHPRPSSMGVPNTGQLYRSVLENICRFRQFRKAGGVITSGAWGYDYHLFGSALGYTINSGRIAGESLVEFLRGE